MPFVKLDCGILNSTLWLEREAREVFITALLMAEPYEATVPMPQLQVHALDETGFIVPPGWYGFVPAAGVGIVHRAGLAQDRGLAALERLGNPEESSRSPEFGGRRLVRVDGGYIVLNFFKYRDRDYTTAERSRRYRERLASRRGDTKSRVTERKNVARTRDITQAEAEAEVEAKKKERKSPPPADNRSNRPIFDGQRVTVFEWMLTDCLKVLGPHAEAFDLHAWFYALDAEAVRDGLVIQKRDGGAWLQMQLITEAQRRGIPLKIVNTKTASDVDWEAIGKAGPMKRG